MMTILRMLTGVFAVAVGVFGRGRAPAPPAHPAGTRWRAEERWKRSLDETRATMRRRAAYCEPAGFLTDSAESDPAKLRRAAAWHGKVALGCREAGDGAGHREHSGHAKRYLDAFRLAEARGRSTGETVTAMSTKVRVQCPKCLVRQEREIAVPPEMFHYACPDRDCEGSERAWGWDEAFCEVARDEVVLELACNAVDPGKRVAGPPDDDKVWVTGKGDKIRPADMNNGHLVNTIRYIERKARDARRSRAAGRPHGRGYAPLEGFIGSRLPVYQEMLREADRRGLKHE